MHVDIFLSVILQLHARNKQNDNEIKSINIIPRNVPPSIVFTLCDFNKNQSYEDDIIDECAKNALNEIGKEICEIFGPSSYEYNKM